MLVCKHGKILCCCSSYIFSHHKNTCFKEKFTAISNSEIKVFLKSWRFERVSGSTQGTSQERHSSNCRPGLYPWVPAPHSPQVSPKTRIQLTGTQRNWEIEGLQASEGPSQTYAYKILFCCCCMVITSVIRTLAVYLWVSWLSLLRVPSAQHHIWIPDSLLASPFPFHPLHYLPLALGGISISLKQPGGKNCLCHLLSMQGFAVEIWGHILICSCNDFMKYRHGEISAAGQNFCSCVCAQTKFPNMYSVQSLYQPPVQRIDSSSIPLMKRDIFYPMLQIQI